MGWGVARLTLHNMHMNEVDIEKLSMGMCLQRISKINFMQVLY
jgi:hypothetical protein